MPYSCAMYNAQYNICRVGWWCQIVLMPKPWCCDLLFWQWGVGLGCTPLVSSVIPANLGFSFTRLCGHNLRLESTGNMETQRAYPSTGFIWRRMYLLVLVQILQSTLLAVRSCPASCACTYGNSGPAELRSSEADFILMSACLCVQVTSFYNSLYFHNDHTIEALLEQTQWC